MAASAQNLISQPNTRNKHRPRSVFAIKSLLNQTFGYGVNIE